MVCEIRIGGGIDKGMFGSAVHIGRAIGDVDDCRRAIAAAAAAAATPVGGGQSR